MNRPDAIVDFLESDGVLLQRVGDEEQALLEPKRPRVRDAFHDEMPGILDRRHRPGVRPGRGPIAGRRRGAGEKLMGPFVVVLSAEAVERTLLGRERGAWRANRLRLERLVHPFVRAIVLRRRRSAALMLNAEPQPTRH